MSEHTDQNVKIIAFVGLAGSGKTAAVEHLTEQGHPKVYFGGVIYKAMLAQGIQPGDWEREGPFREEIREKEGKDFVVKQVVKEARELIAAGQHRIVLDGLYTWTEYKILRHEFPGEMTVVAIVTPKHLRKQRMGKRPERPMTPIQVDERDWEEIENLEKGGPIAIADYFVHNEGDLDALYRQLDQVQQTIEF